VIAVESKSFPNDTLLIKKKSNCKEAPFFI